MPPVPATEPKRSFFPAADAVSRSRGLLRRLPACAGAVRILDGAWPTPSAEPRAALRRLLSQSRAGVERAWKAQAADAAAQSSRYDDEGAPDPA
ncbi:hypothetical protein ACIP4T_32660 [Streptomyces massasporeus]|uniref:hypothetical protein n=1 Tax=Streptomyces massasporeus TaxID=67324 RepID=UPI0036B4216D